MPELPEVETVRRGLEPVLTGKVITRLETRREGLRFAFPPGFVQAVSGERVTGLGRRAKYLLASLGSGATLLVHLGMTGRFLVAPPGGERAMQGEFHHPAGWLVAHDHVIVHLDDGTRVIYNDVRRFGFMDLIAPGGLADNVHLRGLGLEPLGNALSGEVLAGMMAGRMAPLKAALLDQRLIAGLGNIYVCEALFRSGLSPLAPAGSIATPEGAPLPAAQRLAATIREVLEEAVAAGGSTLRDFSHADGSLGYFQHSFRVYDREGDACSKPGCGGTVMRMVQSGRSTFYCPNCQPAPVRVASGA
jgi:formamidopyrimidine-DNA glycosylase